MKLSKASILFLLMASLFFTVHLQAQEEWIQQHVIPYDGHTAIFPASWLEKKTRAKATAADTALYANDTAALALAWGKVPGSVLEKELDNVYIVGSLRFGGQQFTGTNSQRDIYIAGGNKEQTERTFHHELSSILLRNYADDHFMYEWKQLSPSLRQGTSAAAVRNGLYSVELDEGLMAKGYLSPYSLSNAENDFNMYAEYLFCGGKHFWQLAARFPIVQQKLKLIIGFYHDKIWSGYSESFFKGLAE